ncbi:GNAT family N-acetyltransferase [Bacillus sp. JCM 19034]|uniref:GNAT family N-acetyltransferase n=1 Tax=Bacillus sp. JCM 19034 TaxID=1481928 RepID=UPI00078089E2|nr:GNAT family N-acetyltransferase [Bacillus sp. JCM 19034]
MYFRLAKKEDVPEIVRMLSDDVLGSQREKYENPLPNVYYEAFEEIEKQAGNQILLAIEGEKIVGFLQLTIIPGLARLGMKRAQIEGVRVDRHFRGQGIGEALFKEAITISKDSGCGLVQLTTDKQRKDSHRFYEKLGFTATHDGMKLIFS